MDTRYGLGVRRTSIFQWVNYPRVLFTPSRRGFMIATLARGVIDVTTGAVPQNVVLAGTSCAAAVLYGHKIPGMVIPVLFPIRDPKMDPEQNRFYDLVVVDI